MEARNTCIIFGAGGYIGRHLVSYLTDSGFNIKAYDLDDTIESFDVDYSKIDILNIQELKNINWNVGYVFMFAGITGTWNGFDNYDQYVKLNEIGLLNILHEIVKSEYNPRIVYPSSRLVYKGSDLPLNEDDQKETKTIYAINKTTCENLLYAYMNSFKIPYTIYRICVPYGNNSGEEYSFGTIGSFLNQAKNNGAINLYGDGSLRRTFTHIEDICKQIILSCQGNKSLNQVYNTIGEPYSLKEAALMIAEKHNATITFSEWPEKEHRIESGHTVFNSQKLQNDFNLELNNSLKEWLAHL